MNSATVIKADEQEAAAFLWALDRDSFAELCAAFARHREAERARIVAWLRNGKTWLNGGECCGAKDSGGVCFAPACVWGWELALLHTVADAIEAGEHLT